jgi:hypothetical protein
VRLAIAWHACAWRVAGSLECRRSPRRLGGVQNLNEDRFVDDREAAELLHLSRSYLRQLRLNGDGCRYSRFGRAIRYKISDLLAWAATKSVSSTSAGDYC